MLAFWLLVALGVGVGVLVFINERDLERRVKERRIRTEPGDVPRVALIVAAVGGEPGMEASLESLATLAYSSYDLILAVKDSGAIPRGKLPDRMRVIFCGAAPEGMRQDAHNALAAALSLGRLATVLAFVPPGALVGRAWLGAIVRPLRSDGALAAAGACWLLPSRPGFWTRVHNLWSAGVPAPACGYGIWRSAFEDYRVPEAWTRAGRIKYSLAARFARGAMVGMPRQVAGPAWFGSVAADSRRLLFTLGVCPAMAMALGGIAGGSRGAGAAFVLMLIAAAWQGARRLKLARAELPSQVRWFRREAAPHLLAMPIAWWAGLAAWAAAQTGAVTTGEALQ